MTEETLPFPEESPAPTKDAPRSKRISNPRPKKVTKESPVEAPAVVAEAPASPPPANDWPEPEPASSGAAPAPEHPKRKRRRKKGKGGGSQQQPQANENEPQTPTAVSDSSEAPAAPQVSNKEPQAPRPHPQPRIKFDAEVIAKLAWKIYLSEVSEEGVALIGDGDAKELARRCFRLSEIFMEEQFRRG